MKRILLAFILLSSNLCIAQKSVEVGGWLGANYYFGDLNSSFNLTDPHPAGGLVLRYNMNSRVNYKTSINYGRFSATDVDSDNLFERNRNLSFKSNVFDWTNQIDFNFLPYEHGHDENWYTPYLFLGVSLYHFDPQADLSGETYRLQPLGTEGQLIGEEYSLYGLALAYGVGYKFDISTKWSINIELSNRLMFTDYFDDVSATYGDPFEISSSRGEVAGLLSDRSLTSATTDIGDQRGNSRKNDSAHYLGISLLYNISWLSCPKISKIR